MENCIFCKIIKGEIPCYKIYEDEKTLAFLEIKPVNPGHIIVIPKIHHQFFYDLENNHYIALMNTVQKMGVLVNEKFNPVRVGVLIYGFDVDHVHVHVIPINDKKDIALKTTIDRQEKNEGNLSKEGLEEVSKSLTT